MLSQRPRTRCPRPQPGHRALRCGAACWGRPPRAAGQSGSSWRRGARGLPLPRRWRVPRPAGGRARASRPRAPPGSARPAPRRPCAQAPDLPPASSAAWRGALRQSLPSPAGAPWQRRCARRAPLAGGSLRPASRCGRLSASSARTWCSPPSTGCTAPPRRARPRCSPRAAGSRPPARARSRRRCRGCCAFPRARRPPLRSAHRCPAPARRSGCVPG